MAGDFGLGLIGMRLDYYRNCMCSIQEVKKLEMMISWIRGWSYGPHGPAFLCCCWILIHLIAYILLLKESNFLNL